MLPFLSPEVYLADDFVSISEAVGFVNNFFEKSKKKFKRGKTKEKRQNCMKNATNKNKNEGGI